MSRSESPTVNISCTHDEHQRYISETAGFCTSTECMHNLLSFTSKQFTRMLLFNFDADIQKYAKHSDLIQILAAPLCTDCTYYLFIFTRQLQTVIDVCNSVQLKYLPKYLENRQNVTAQSSYRSAIIQMVEGLMILSRMLNIKQIRRKCLALKEFRNSIYNIFLRSVDFISYVSNNVIVRSRGIYIYIYMSSNVIKS